MSYTLRKAQPADTAGLTLLIERSARALSAGYYTPFETEAAIRYVFGVDSQLIADQTYLAVEHETQLVGCGGWSRRRTLYGGDKRPVGSRETLVPGTDAARIRAFFVAPEHARRGVGRLLFAACHAAAVAEGFTRFELMATLPGVPLYEALGFVALESVHDLLSDGTSLAFVRMGRAI